MRLIGMKGEGNETVMRKRISERASKSRAMTVAILLLIVARAGDGISLDQVADLSKINDAAAYLAGVELPHKVDEPLASLSSWQSHCKTLDKEFASHFDRVLFPMSKWSGAQLPPQLSKGSTVRYLFSGPDILHAFHMFPTADTYILCGLEPVGELPNLNEINSGNASRALAEVRNALGEIINFSFFRTKDMKEDLKFATFRGTTPIIMIFLVRSGQYVKNVEFLSLETDGSLVSKGMVPDNANVVKIEFSPRRIAETRTLYYFSSDLSDGSFPKSGMETFLEAQPKGDSYLKAASFLMHQKWFSGVREHLLEYSNQIVQDDSGIPFRYFDGKVWYADLFGTYTGPIDLFSQYYQRDLRSAYRSNQKALDFGTGYKWRKGESNLMQFIRQDAYPVKPPAPATDDSVDP